MAAPCRLKSVVVEHGYVTGTEVTLWHLIESYHEILNFLRGRLRSIMDSSSTYDERFVKTLLYLSWTMIAYRYIQFSLTTVQIPETAVLVGIAPGPSESPTDLDIDGFLLPLEEEIPRLLRMPSLFHCYTGQYS